MTSLRVALKLSMADVQPKEKSNKRKNPMLHDKPKEEEPTLDSILSGRKRKSSFDHKDQKSKAPAKDPSGKPKRKNDPEEDDSMSNGDGASEVGAGSTVDAETDADVDAALASIGGEESLKSMDETNVQIPKVNLKGKASASTKYVANVDKIQPEKGTASVSTATLSKKNKSRTENNESNRKENEESGDEGEVEGIADAPADTSERIVGSDQVSEDKPSDLENDSNGAEKKPKKGKKFSLSAQSVVVDAPQDEGEREVEQNTNNDLAAAAELASPKLADAEDVNQEIVVVEEERKGKREEEEEEEEFLGQHFCVLHQYIALESAYYHPLPPTKNNLLILVIYLYLYL
mmetsp:Transcript_25814/g.43332  ORF Transcript_25814/g.43332 Transcript_25814/m.43332 type:complete len:347 (-) Transcript_25814:1117-2157(-)